MTDLTTQILIEIRDEIRGTNGRLDQTNERLDQTNERLDQTNEHLHQMDTRLTKRLDTHEAVLVRLVDLSERHEQALSKLVAGVDALNGRFDHFLTGAHKQAHDEASRKFAEVDERLARLEGKRPRPRRAAPAEGRLTRTSGRRSRMRSA